VGSFRQCWPASEAAWNGTYVLEQTFDLVPPIDWAPMLEPVALVGDHFRATTSASG